MLYKLFNYLWVLRKRGKRVMLKENKGSLTVEASLSLIIFIFAFLSILYLCKFAKAQVVLQHAVNQTAKEISQYSYITNKLGLKNDKTEGNKTIEDTDKMISEVVNLIKVVNTEKVRIEDLDINRNDIVIDDYYDAIKTYKKYDEAGNTIKDSYENIEEATESLIGNAKEYLKDPKALLNGFVAIAKNEIADFAVSKYIAAPMSKLLIQKYLPTDSQSADMYLRRLGVDNGLDGLNFDTSTIFKDGSNINITLIYNMSLNIPLFPKKTLCFRINASTIGWQSKLFYDEKENDNNQDYINIWDYGGARTTDEFTKILMKERNVLAVRTPLSLDFYDNTNSTYTYVHSMNTELKSYSNDGKLNLSHVKSKIKFYAKDAIKDTKRTEKVTMEDGVVYDSSSIKNSQNIKIIMVLKESAVGSSNELNEIILEIKKELKEDNLEIEFYFSDGLIQVGD